MERQISHGERQEPLVTDHHNAPTKPQRGKFTIARARTSKSRARCELSESFEGLIDTLAVKGCDQAADHYLLDVGPGAASVQKRLLRQRVNCCVARAQAGVLLRRLKFALPGWAQAERRRKDWRDQAAQRAAQARAYSCLLYTSPSPRDGLLSRMPSSA